jgi:general secretion pathway protein D
MRIITLLGIALMVAIVSGCEMSPERKEALAPRGHLTEQDAVPPGTAGARTTPPEQEAAPVQKRPYTEIPDIVRPAPVLEPPMPRAEEQQTFTVVVTDVPANELLFALARDAKLNLDVHPDISGKVTLNAIDQTLPQILERIAGQVGLRYRIEGPNLVVSPDTPYLQIYQVDYLNMQRESTGDVAIGLELATTSSGTSGGAGAAGSNNNKSLTSLKNETLNRFWETLENNIAGILDSGEGRAQGVGQLVVSNRETGVMMVRATSRQHTDIQAFIDRVIDSARRQVLIEATIVEVELSNNFQGGVDWSVISNGDGLSVDQAMIAGALGNPPFFSAVWTDNNDDNSITATLKLLDQFGDVSVLSSPKIIALNNQTSVLKVVDNRVYFTIDVQTNTTQGVIDRTFISEVNSIPVGLVMSVTPYITEDDEVILNVRPSISRVLRFVPDPNPALALADVENLIPETTVREMESVLRVPDGQVAVLGGLMQNRNDYNEQGVPGLSTLPGVGKAFGFEERETTKSELVIFLRPRVVQAASVSRELTDYRQYLPKAEPAR